MAIQSSRRCLFSAFDPLIVRIQCEWRTKVYVANARACRGVRLGANLATGHLAKTFAFFGPLIPVDMARGQAKSNIKNNGRQTPVLKDQCEVFGVCIPEV